MGRNDILHPGHRNTGKAVEAAIVGLATPMGHQTADGRGYGKGNDPAGIYCGRLGRGIQTATGQPDMVRVYMRHD